MDFRIIPGMGCWPGMSKKYKKEYFKWQKRNDPPGFYELNQQKIEKEWDEYLKEEERQSSKWLNWME